jgi:hypothetical protein
MWTYTSPAPRGLPPTASPTGPSVHLPPRVLPRRPRVRKRDIANLTHCDPKEIAAIELALRFKNDLAALGSLDNVRLSQGLSVGAVWTAFQTARRLGIDQALGSGFPAQLALWQVLARVLEQGSRLSAVRLAQVHAACDVLGIQRGFDENDLYSNLTWLSAHQEAIEKRLFLKRLKQGKPELFLYDVTSSYLEGEDNAYGAYGYNRDGKKGKKQIVIGLLCDEQGAPVTTEVFRGNTQDPKTFASQVKKASQRFGCERVTFVGDRGMIKSGQVEDLSRAGFHYITAITKPQIDVLIETRLIQMELFAAEVCEVERDGVRYVLRATTSVPNSSRLRAPTNRPPSSNCYRTGMAIWRNTRGPRSRRRKRRSAPRSRN